MAQPALHLSVPAYGGTITVRAFGVLTAIFPMYLICGSQTSIQCQHHQMRKRSLDTGLIRIYGGSAGRQGCKNHSLLHTKVYTVVNVQVHCPRSSHGQTEALVFPRNCPHIFHCCLCLFFGEFHATCFQSLIREGFHPLHSRSKIISRSTVISLMGS